MRVYIYMYIHFVDVCTPRHRDKYGIETRYVIGCYKGYGKVSYQKKKRKKEKKKLYYATSEEASQFQPV